MVYFSPLVVVAAIALNIVPAMALLQGEYPIRVLDGLQTRRPHDIASGSLRSRDFELEARNPQVREVAKKVVQTVGQPLAENKIKDMLNNYVPKKHPNSKTVQLIDQMRAFNYLFVAAVFQHITGTNTILLSLIWCEP